MLTSRYVACRCVYTSSSALSSTALCPWTRHPPHRYEPVCSDSMNSLKLVKLAGVARSPWPPTATPCSLHALLDCAQFLRPVSRWKHCSPTLMKGFGHSTVERSWHESLSVNLHGLTEWWSDYGHFKIRLTFVVSSVLNSKVTTNNFILLEEKPDQSKVMTSTWFWWTQM